jgi:hypothetical protein
VGAWDNDGIDEIRIYVNDDGRRTCNFSNETDNVKCSYVLEAEDYDEGDTIYVRARIRDADGETAWSDEKHITRAYDDDDDDDYDSYDDVHITGWVDGDGILDPDETIVYHTESRADQGVDFVEIYVDNEPAHSCRYNASRGTMRCDHSVYHQGQPDNTKIRLKAKAIDADGNVDWSDESVITVRTPRTEPDDDGDDETYDMSAWDWLEPDQTTITYGYHVGNRVEYHAGAWAEAGVQSITIYVDGNAERKCSYWPGEGNKDCWVEIDAWNYTPGTEVSMNALVVDFEGNQKWTDGKQLTIKSNAILLSGANTDNQSATISVWSNRDGGFSSNDTITISASGSDPDGVSHIDIFVDAVRVKRCSNATSCSVTVGPTSNKYVNYAATIVDTYGNITTTGYKQIERF